MTHSRTEQLAWILNEVVDSSKARAAVLFSADGMVMCTSRDVPTDQAERAAATSAGLQALSRSAAEFVSGGQPLPWASSIISFFGGHLMLMAAGANAHLAVSVGPDADSMLVTDLMTDAVTRLEAALGVEERAPQPGLR